MIKGKIKLLAWRPLRDKSGCLFNDAVCNWILGISAAVRKSLRSVTALCRVWQKIFLFIFFWRENTQKIFMIVWLLLSPRWFFTFWWLSRITSYVLASQKIYSDRKENLVLLFVVIRDELERKRGWQANSKGGRQVGLKSSERNFLKILRVTIMIAKYASRHSEIIGEIIQMGFEDI